MSPESVFLAQEFPAQRQPLLIQLPNRNLSDPVSETEPVLSPSGPRWFSSWSVATPPSQEAAPETWTTPAPPPLPSPQSC